MVERDPIVSARDMVLSIGLATEALAAAIPPWCGVGWGTWAVYLACATVGFAIAMRFVWSG